LEKLKKREGEKKQKQIHLGKEKQAPSQSFASLNSLPSSCSLLFLPFPHLPVIKHAKTHDPTSALFTVLALLPWW
jgi:hypothetical protein